MKTLFLFFLPALLLAQVGPNCPNGTAGQALICSINAAAGSPAASQLTLVAPASWGLPTVTAGAAAVAAQKSAACYFPSGVCLVWGFNPFVIPAGELLHLVFQIPSNVSGQFQIGVSGVLEADTGANAIPGITANPPFAVSVSPSANYCDIDGDGALTHNDVAALAAAIGATPPVPHDLNGDGFTNVLDLQALINAVDAGACWR
jgi:hypothetical protein